MNDCGVVSVNYYDKTTSISNGYKSKVTEIGVYQFLAFLSDVGGILKVTGLIVVFLTGSCHNKWIKAQLRKIHGNIDYILSYEGLTGLFEDVQRLKRIILNYLILTTRANTSRLDEHEAQLQVKDKQIK